MGSLREILILWWLVQFSILGHAQAVTPDVPSLAPMLEPVLPGIVSIASHGRTTNEQDPLLADPYVKKFFGLPENADPGEHEFWTAGSGIIADARKGYVLTSRHVVESADDINVVLMDGRRLVATVLGVDESTDLALLQVTADDLTAPALGNSDRLRVGDYVVAVGNPFALGQTVTLGIVSGIRRNGSGMQPSEDYIQTDALINPGNSGGALVNLRGEVIGINNMVFAPSGSSGGIGLAVPINIARGVMRELIRQKNATREFERSTNPQYGLDGK
jgi:S1-C subfamily serine protease